MVIVLSLLIFPLWYFMTHPKIWSSLRRFASCSWAASVKVDQCVYRVCIENASPPHLSHLHEMIRVITFLSILLLLLLLLLLIIIITTATTTTTQNWNNITVFICGYASIKLGVSSFSLVIFTYSLQEIHKWYA